MMRLISYFFGIKLRERLPQLHRQVWSPFDATDVDPEIHLILMAGVAPDPDAAADLLREYKVTTAAELLTLLPRRSFNIMRKLRNLLMRIEGSYPSDPHKQDYQKLKRMARNDYNNTLG